MNNKDVILVDVGKSRNEDKKCFKCGTTITSFWRKRDIDGKWDGKNWFCNKCYWRRKNHSDKYEDKDDILDKEILSDKEKIIIFSMLAVRTFSRKSPVDLYKDEIVRNEWKDIIEKSYEKLKEFNLIKLDRHDLYDGSRIDPIGNLFRANTMMLHKKTRGLFRRSGDTIYFLDIFRESKILGDDINYLLKLIGEEILNDLEEIYSFCLNISNDKSIFIFNPKEHIFSKPEFDDIMKDIILYSFY